MNGPKRLEHLEPRAVGQPQVDDEGRPAMICDDGFGAAYACDDGHRPPLAEQLPQAPAVGRVVLHDEVKSLARLVLAHQGRKLSCTSRTTIQVPGSATAWQY